MSYWEGIIVIIIATVQLIVVVVVVVAGIVIVIVVVYVVSIHVRAGMRVGNTHWFLIVNSNITHIHSRGRRRRRTRNRVVFRDIDCTFDIIRKVIGLLFYVDMESVG